MIREEPRHRIEIQRDQDAYVYFIQSSTIPGVHLETESYAELLEVICEFVPELLTSNLGFTEEMLNPVFIEVTNLETYHHEGPHILSEMNLPAI